MFHHVIIMLSSSHHHVIISSYHHHVIMSQSSFNDHHLREVSADVGLGDIHQPKPHVHNTCIIYYHVSLYCTVLYSTRGAVVLLAGVDTHFGPEPGPLRGVQHMGHAQQAQVLCVPGSGSEVKM